jgi:hypothetical protein
MFHAIHLVVNRRPAAAAGHALRTDETKALCRGRPQVVSKEANMEALVAQRNRRTSGLFGAQDASKESTLVGVVTELRLPFRRINYDRASSNSSSEAHTAQQTRP